jgi:hypothetical protein
VCIVILVQREPDLLQVVRALGPRRGIAHLLDGRDEQAKEHADYRKDDEQFDQAHPASAKATNHKRWPP